MTSMREMWWPLGTAFIIALVLTPIFRDIFHSYNVVDRPGFRKIHAYPIPRLGGISIALAFAVALIRSPELGGSVLWKLLPGAGVIVLTGILDDFFNLPARYKLVGQVVAAGVAFLSGLRIDKIAGASLPMSASLLLTVFWLLLASNALNLIDGLDGLCAGIGLVGSAALFVAGLLQGNVPLVFATLPLMGALLGFLLYNFSRATMFLGDSGALLIGFLVGCYGIMYAERATALGFLAPLMVLAVPLADVSLSIVRRSILNRPIFAADKGHIHHRLVNRFRTPQLAVRALLFWAALGGVFALLLGGSSRLLWQGIVVLGFCATVGAGIKELRYSEFKVAAKLLMGGEFRRTLAEKARIQNLADALERCETETEWWNLLVSAGREAGWFGLIWTRDRSVVREQVFPGREGPAGWSLSVPLAEDEYLRVEGGLQSEHPLDLNTLAQAVHASFAGRRRAWARPAVS
jgi:UDP-GlcNAc:undecaprenyl-phosphate GlcNAc-1-phosphate transferase